MNMMPDRLGVTKHTLQPLLRKKGLLVVGRISARMGRYQVD